MWNKLRRMWNFRANKTKDFLSMYPSYFIFSFDIFLFSFSFSFPMCPIFSFIHFRYTQTPSRSRQALSNAYLDAKIGVDTEENKPFKLLLIPTFRDTNVILYTVSRSF